MEKIWIGKGMKWIGVAIAVSVGIYITGSVGIYITGSAWCLWAFLIPAMGD